MTTPPRNPPARDILQRSAPYVLPFAAFMLMLALAENIPHRHYLFYPVRAAAVGIILAYYWRRLPDMRVRAPLISIMIGVIGVIAWVGLDPISMRLNAAFGDALNYIYGVVGLTSWQGPVSQIAPLGRNPFLLYPAPEAWTLYSLRVLGISICVPIMEELFWRGFLMRWLIKEDFTAVPLGTYQAFSFWSVTILFALEHGSEWLLGLIVGTLFGVFFVRTKSLGNVILAHGTTNLLMALYCVAANDWHFLSTVATPTTPP